MSKYTNPRNHNRYFNNRTDTLEQDLYENHIIDYHYDRGDVISYIPRIVLSRDSVLQIDEQILFGKGFELPALVVDLGAEEDNFVALAFGMVNDAGTRVEIAIKTFREKILENGFSKELYSEPLAGDLIYIGYGNNTFKNSIYEITKVGVPSNVWAHGGKFVWNLNLKLFKYNNEEFQTGIESVDQITNKYDNDFNIANAINNASALEQPKIINNEKNDPIKHDWDDWDG